LRLNRLLYHSTLGLRETKKKKKKKKTDNARLDEARNSLLVDFGVPRGL